MQMSGLRVTCPVRHICLNLRQRLGLRQAVEALLSAGASVKTLDTQQAGPLHAAARSGSLQVFERLQQAGADPGAADAAGVTVLHTAALGACWPLAAQALELGGQLDAVSTDGLSALHYAALGMPRSSLGNMMCACTRVLRNSERFRAILPAVSDVGSRPTHRHEYTGTPLRCSSVGTFPVGGSSEVVKQLLDQGCALDVRDAGGSLPWHFAVRSGSPDLVELLLQRGSDLEAANDEGQRAIHFAVQSGAT